MSKRSDYGLITDFDCWRHPAWNSFTDLMDGRLYGSDPLNQAWAFYKAGWVAGQKDANKVR